MKMILIFFAPLILLACNSVQNDAEDGRLSTDVVSNPATASDVDKAKPVPEIKFAEDLFDFGKIIQGEKVKHTYRFKNTGKADLVITDVSSSCGCTVPSWPQEPVAAGEEGVIEVVFDSEGKSGWQTRKIQVLSNTVPNITALNFVGEVLIP